MLNSVNIQGRLVKEAEVKLSGSGTSYTQFTLACQRNIKNKDGIYEADFINCKAFGGTAELVGRYFKKGDMMIVEGRLQVDKATDKNTGETKWFTNIIANQVQFCGGKSAANENDNDEIPF